MLSEFRSLGWDISKSTAQRHEKLDDHEINWVKRKEQTMLKLEWPYMIQEWNVLIKINYTYLCVIYSKLMAI